jgi:hypothetical protein
VDKHQLKKMLADPALPANVRRALELRQQGAPAAPAKFDLRRVGADGRMRGLFNYHAAHTGRWSSSGFQFQNLVRETDEDLGLAITAVLSGDIEQVRAIGEPLAVVSGIVRALPCAGPGKVLVCGDYGSIESRVIVLLAGETRKLEQYAKYDEDGDPDDEPYRQTAAEIFGKVPADITREERQVGKFCELAFNYAGGVGAFRSIARDSGFTDDEIEVFKNGWRAAHPSIVRFWYALDDAARLAVEQPGRITTAGMIQFQRDGDALHMILPGGRKLWYWHPRVEIGERGRPVLVHKVVQNSKWVDCRDGAGMYGGIWAENATQAVARDLLADAMLRADADGLQIVAHCHDEIVVEALEADGERVENMLGAIMVEIPTWAEGLPIAVETRRGRRYCKTGQDVPITEFTAGFAGAIPASQHAELEDAESEDAELEDAELEDADADAITIALSGASPTLHLLAGLGGLQIDDALVLVQPGPRTTDEMDEALETLIERLAELATVTAGRRNNALFREAAWVGEHLLAPGLLDEETIEQHFIADVFAVWDLDLSRDGDRDKDLATMRRGLKFTRGRNRKRDDAGILKNMGGAFSFGFASNKWAGGNGRGRKPTEPPSRRSGISSLRATTTGTKPARCCSSSAGLSSRARLRNFCSAGRTVPAGSGKSKTSARCSTACRS